MRYVFNLLVCPAALLAMTFTAGCQPAAGPTGPVTVNTPTDAPPEVPDAHEHPTEGPHHGDLVELGDEEYHGEVVHDDSAVTIYILDSAAKATVGIEAKTITINAMVDGKPKQFSLTAEKQESDAEGTASKFVSSEVALAKVLDQEDAMPRLSLTIAGKPYTGEIKHDHDHDHDHK